MTQRKSRDDASDVASNARKAEVHDPREANAEVGEESLEDAGLPLPIEENDFNSVPQ